MIQKIKLSATKTELGMQLSLQSNALKAYVKEELQISSSNLTEEFNFKLDDLIRVPGVIEQGKKKAPF